MGTWTTHVRIPAQDYRDDADPERVISDALHRVRTALRGAASDPEVEVSTWWSAIIPGVDPTAHEGSTDGRPYGRGETSVMWQPGAEPLPEAATEIVCRGSAVT